MNFSQALDSLKSGVAITRDGWNGKNMFVYMVPANKYPATTPVAKAAFGDDALVPYNAYFALKGTDEAVSTWTPSTGDLMAEDWRHV